VRIAGSVLLKTYEGVKNDRAASCKMITKTAASAEPEATETTLKESEKRSATGDWEEAEEEES
jgi:hypothetical protein